MTLIDNTNATGPWAPTANDINDNYLTKLTPELDITMSTLAELDAEFEPDIQSPPGIDEPEPGTVRAPVARCADGNGTMVGLFFSDHIVDIERAKAMCALCPLADQCLADALEREEPWGVWGGELLSGGRVIANKRPCGRPPKNPRPDVVYDEMGPVGIALTA